jgi:hypothetical protein
MATSAEATRPADTITFAHNSERQFARLLDFYRVEWEYEPTAFPIEWDAAGHAVQHFRPDFYLPRFDLYIEITTLNQRLVTKKNRKVRRLRELYPDVHIKVLYQRDYLSLLAKYGLEAPSQMLDPAAEGGTPAAQGAGEGEPAAAGAGEAQAAGAAEAADPSSGGARAPGTGQGRSPKLSGRAVEPAPEPSEPAGGAPGGARRRPRPAAGPAPERPTGAPDGAPEPAQSSGAVERVREAGRPRVVPDPPGPVPPLPADPELVRLAQVLLPAERTHRRGPATAKRAG